MEWLTPFTNWSWTDPQYFYIRGAIMGGLVTLLVICVSYVCAAIRCKRRILKAIKESNNKQVEPVEGFCKKTPEEIVAEFDERELELNRVMKRQVYDLQVYFCREFEKLYELKSAVLARCVCGQGEATQNETQIEPMATL